jgi:hypothetical protein
VGLPGALLGGFKEQKIIIFWFSPETFSEMEFSFFKKFGFKMKSKLSFGS